MKKHKQSKISVKRNHDSGKKEKDIPKGQNRKSAEQPCECGYDDTLPWWCPYLVTIVTMTIRVSYVTSSRSWWILHPDEVYQSIEVGFSEMSGYGFRSYEYLPAPTNATISMETQALTSGMFALRSFVLPYIFSMATIVAKLAGATWSSFMIGRVFNVMVTSTLPLAVYNLAFTTFRCRLVALLSCALTASSVHLAVFGIHPLVNSFTAPFIITGLYLCLDATASTASCDNGVYVTHGQCKSSSDVNGNVLKTNQTFHNSVTLGNRKMSNENGFGIEGKGEIDAQRVPLLRKNKCTDQQTIAEDIKTTSSKQRYTTTLSSSLKAYFGGVIIGFTCYIRPDISLFVVVIYVPLTIVMEATWTTKFRTFLITTSGGLSSVLLCILEDFRRYGIFLFSPVQWFRFNVLSQKASLMFSTENSNAYTDIASLDQIGVILNACALIILTLIPFIKTLQIHTNKQFYVLVISHVILMTIYSCIGHKEPRIIHNSFILQAIVSGITIHHITIALKRIGVKSSYVKQSLFIVILLSAIASYRKFPSIKDNTAADWSYKDPEVSRDVNLCLNFIRSQNDVSGVVVNASVYNFGGFSVLEHDVPLLVQVHFEYHLYEAKHHNRLGENNRIRVFTDFSDFIDIDNQPYVHKTIRDYDLNYVVTQTFNARELEQLSYEVIFTFGKLSVLRKTHQSVNRVNVYYLETIENANILEYEANWLITNGLYQKAIWRIKTALDVNRKLRQKSRVRLFQLLMICYGKMKQLDMVKLYQDECFSIYGRDTCVTQQDKITRHEEYSRFN